jgi:hypothetical protein
MTDDAKPPLHAVFGMCAAASLRQALAQLGRDERVIGFPDDLSCGPINPPSAELRAAWVEEELGTDWDDVSEMAEQFWAEATSPSVLPTAWVSRRCAQEYTAFLEFLERIDDAAFRVVDLTDVEFAWSSRRPPSPAFAFGIVTPKQMIEAGLIERQRELSGAELRARRATWRHLKSENAPLRIVTRTGLVSAPITYFDDFVLSCVADQWRKGARVVGEALGRMIDEPFCQTGDLVLWARVRALVDAGRVESQGDLSSMRHSEVRRAQTPAAA